MLKIRRVHDRLLFDMVIPIPGETIFILRRGPVRLIWSYELKISGPGASPRYCGLDLTLSVIDGYARKGRVATVKIINAWFSSKRIKLNIKIGQGHDWSSIHMSSTIHDSHINSNYRSETMPPAYLSSHMKTSSNGNIFRVTGPVCGEFTGPRWFPHTKATDAELWCFLWSTPE